MIRPTIGRIVWLHRSHNLTEQPEAATIAFVHSDSVINVGAFDANGNHFSATSVYLWQGDGPEPTCEAAGTWAEWMPFQKGQAARYEARDAAPAPAPAPAPTPASDPPAT